MDSWKQRPLLSADVKLLSCSRLTNQPIYLHSSFLVQISPAQRRTLQLSHCLSFVGMPMGRLPERVQLALTRARLRRGGRRSSKRSSTPYKMALRDICSCALGGQRAVKEFNPVQAFFCPALACQNACCWDGHLAQFAVQGFSTRLRRSAP